MRELPCTGTAIARACQAEVDRQGRIYDQVDEIAEALREGRSYVDLEACIQYRVDAHGAELIRKAAYIDRADPDAMRAALDDLRDWFEEAIAAEADALAREAA